MQNNKKATLKKKNTARPTENKGSVWLQLSSMLSSCCLGIQVQCDFHTGQDTCVLKNSLGGWSHSPTTRQDNMQSMFHSVWWLRHTSISPKSSRHHSDRYLLLYSPKDPEVSSFHHPHNTTAYATVTLSTLKKEMCSVLDVGTDTFRGKLQVKYTLGILF